jgi:predicted MPP superfamily phosphohydrolase
MRSKLGVVALLGRRPWLEKSFAHPVRLTTQLGNLAFRIGGRNAWQKGLEACGDLALQGGKKVAVVDLEITGVDDVQNGLSQQAMTVDLIGQLPESATADERHLGEVNEDLAGVLFAHQMPALDDLDVADIIAASVAIRGYRNSRRNPGVHKGCGLLR